MANPELVKDIIERRVKEDAAVYLTYCAMCRDLFASSGKQTLHLLDLVYGKNLQKLVTRKGPDYSQRHENRIRTKQKLEKLIQGKENISLEPYEKIMLKISPDIRETLENRLILVEDIQKVIFHIEQTGEYFVNPQSGHKLGFYKPNIITYWVEYEEDGGLFTIFNAYSHRMDFEGNER